MYENKGGWRARKVKKGVEWEGKTEWRKIVEEKGNSNYQSPWLR
jgi:hypothetical protein